eukprot:CAMPEP_0184739736 /NCGR_PEP_ID=MMETSP0315-20130426/2678_1 /TAXON_ID=101924 /ORGANISM="Rhodosorus marinus, Strain UTEX LB 2760" /LENGTH=440 /DNA_ID=CAMNT_0027208877 /DNA_START=89 /DNA_END=1411 /DNA_ORIENTATION=-
MHTLQVDGGDAEGSQGVKLFNSSWTFDDIPSSQLVRSVAVLKMTQYKPVVTYGPKLFSMAQNIPVVRESANFVAKRTFFKQFCGGETLEECIPLADRLQHKGVACIYDYSVEASPEKKGLAKSPTCYDQTARIISDSVGFAHRQGHRAFVCVKVSGVVDDSVLEKSSRALMSGNLKANLHQALKDLKSENPPGLTGNDKTEFMAGLDRLDMICQAGHQLDVPILIDAEQYSLQAAIDLCAVAMQKRYNREKPWIYSTLQSYLKTAPARLDFLRESALENNFKYALKHVRGAYMVSERQTAEKSGYSSPICESESSTHEQYDNHSRQMLRDLSENGAAALFATHNANSLRRIAEGCSRMNIPKSSPRLHFAQLYGMGDTLTIGMAKAGFNAAKYVPYGPISEALPYLSRRLEENNNALSGAPVDIQMFTEELKKRDLILRL